MRLEMVKLEKNYERWKSVGEQDIFKEGKYYVSDNNSSADTTRDVKMVTEVPEGYNTLCKRASLMTSF